MHSVVDDFKRVPDLFRSGSGRHTPCGAKYVFHKLEDMCSGVFGECAEDFLPKGKLLCLDCYRQTGIFGAPGTCKRCVDEYCTSKEGENQQA